MRLFKSMTPLGCALDVESRSNFEESRNNREQTPSLQGSLGPFGPEMAKKSQRSDSPRRHLRENNMEIFKAISSPSQEFTPEGKFAFFPHDLTVGQGCNPDQCSDDRGICGYRAGLNRGKRKRGGFASGCACIVSPHLWACNRLSGPLRLRVQSRSRTRLRIAGRFCFALVLKGFSTQERHYRAVEPPKRFRTGRLRTPNFARKRDRAR